MIDKESEAKLELNRYIYGKNLDKDDIVEYLSIIFDLINKQSKEIEELKEDSCCMTNCVRRDKEKLFLEDKIKTKIEEYKEKCKNCNFRGKICKEFKQNYNCTIAMCLKEFYSLLEKD